MPTYEYHCDACEHNFDEFQSINDPPLKKCPKCGKLKLRRIFGAGGAIVFKGSGFYQTDYRSESYKKRAEADKPASESKSADSKPSESRSTETKSENRSSESKSSGDGAATKPEKKTKKDD